VVEAERKPINGHEEKMMLTGEGNGGQNGELCLLSDRPSVILNLLHSTPRKHPRRSELT